MLQNRKKYQFNLSLIVGNAKVLVKIVKNIYRIVEI